MKSLVALCLCFSLAHAQTTRKPSHINDTDDRVLLSQLPAAEAQKFRAIGRLVSKDNLFLCTASLVGPHLVLTAAHCLMPIKQTKILSADNFVFQIAWDDTSVVVKSLVKEIHAGLPGGPINDRKMLINDWALLEISEDLGSTYGTLEVLPSKDVKDVSHVGFPGDLKGAKGYEAYYQNACAIRGRDGDLIAHDCDWIDGQSGGPLLQKQKDDRYAIVAVTNGMIRDFEYGHVMYHWARMPKKGPDGKFVLFPYDPEHPNLAAPSESFMNDLKTLNAKPSKASEAPFR